MRASIYDWGKEILTLRKTIINADHGLMVTFEDILKEYKSFNDTPVRLKKRAVSYSDELKD